MSKLVSAIHEGEQKQIVKKVLISQRKFLCKQKSSFALIGTHARKEFVSKL